MNGVKYLLLNKNITHIEHIEFYHDDKLEQSQVKKTYADKKVHRSQNTHCSSSRPFHCHSLSGSHTSDLHVCICPCCHDNGTTCCHILCLAEKKHYEN